MAETKLNGNDYVVWIDTTTATSASRGSVYSVIMCATTNGFSGTRETIEVSDKCSSSGFASPLAGTASWSITGSGNAIDESGVPSSDSYQTLFELWKAGEPFWAKIANADPNKGTSYIREGVVILTDYTETQDLNTPFTFDFTFTGVDEPIGTTTT